MGSWEIINALGYVLIYPNYAIILLLTKHFMEKVLSSICSLLYCVSLSCHSLSRWTNTGTVDCHIGRFRSLLHILLVMQLFFIIPQIEKGKISDSSSAMLVV